MPSTEAGYECWQVVQKENELFCARWIEPLMGEIQVFVSADGQWLSQNEIYSLQMTLLTMGSQLPFFCDAWQHSPK